MNVCVSTYDEAMSFRDRVLFQGARAITALLGGMHFM